MRRYVGQFVADLDASPGLETAIERGAEFRVGERVCEANRQRQGAAAPGQRIELGQQLQAQDVDLTAVEDVAAAALAVGQRGPAEDVAVVAEETDELGPKPGTPR